jgi:HK97 family phage portal protein
VASLKWWPAKGPPRIARKALTGTPEVLESIRERNGAPWALLGGGSRQRIQDAYNTAHSASYAWMYRSSPAVRTVVDTIARNVGQLDLRLYEEISEAEREPRPEHSAALSIRYPNESDSSDRWIRQMFKQFLINDDAYSVMLPANGDRFSVISVPTHLVEVSGASMWRAESYIITKRDGTRDRWPVENIMHWRGENPDDPRIGLSVLESIRSVIAEDAALQVAITELANAGLTEPVWAFRPLEAPLISDPATVERMEEDTTNKLFRRNRRVPVFQEGTELRSFGVSPRDAQMFEVRKWALKRVADVYGLTLDDDLNVVREAFYADTLPPYCESFTRFLNHRVLVTVYNWTDGCFEFNLDEKHMGDDRLKALVSATGRATHTTNEARAMLNLPPLDGGDELVTPLNVIVGENPKPSTDVMGPQNPNTPAQDGSARDGDMPEVARRAVRIPTGKELVEAEDAGMSVGGIRADYAPSARLEARSRRSTPCDRRLPEGCRRPFGPFGAIPEGQGSPIPEGDRARLATAGQGVRGEPERGSRGPRRFGGVQVRNEARRARVRPLAGRELPQGDGSGGR